MNGRALALLLLSSMLLMLVLVNSGKQENNQQKQDNAATLADNDETVNGLESESSDQALWGSDESVPAENLDLNSIEDDQAIQASDSAIAQDQNKSSSNEKSSDSLPGQQSKEGADSMEPRRFFTIGSVGLDSPYRYLITINPMGGTVRRVELNFRRPEQTRFKYRDMEYQGGYLGCLDCLDTTEGVLVRTVGAGTPAAKAEGSGGMVGIEPGDFILAIEDEPIFSAAEFERWLAEKTRPRSEIKLQVRRNQKDFSQTIDFSIKLTNKPIEITGPEIHPYFPELVFPESFNMALLKPLGIHNESWPELDSAMRKLAWEVRNIDEDAIELSYNLDEVQLAKLDFSGLTAVKRIQLPKVSDEQRHQFDSRTFHYLLELGIENRADQKQTVTYQLDGPTGSTTEAWWYTHKTHGRQSAIGYTAGARDVIGSTEYEPFIFKGCPEITQGAIDRRPFPQFISNPAISKSEARHLKFVGVDTLYFNTTIIPKTEAGIPFEVNSVTAFPSGPIPAREQKKFIRLTDCTFQLFKTVELEPGESYRQTFDVFCGPKDKTVLMQYGLDDVRVFGWFAAFSKPLMALLKFFYWATGSFSYGLAIIMLTVLVRTIMIPISRKAALNAQMMQYLQPQMQEIRDKYKNDMEKIGLAQRELFKKYNYNPFSGCLMLFLQLPIFIGLFRGLSVDIALRDQPLIPGIGWCKNLAAPDKLWNWKEYMPAFLGDEIGFLGPYLNILPLVTVVLFLVQQKMFMPPPTDDQQKLMQKMMTYMMVFMGVLFFKVPSGLCVYFITSSLWGIIERKMLPKPVLDTDKLALKSNGSSSPSSSSATGRLLGINRKSSNGSIDPDAHREAQLAERKQRDAERKKRLKKRDR